MRDNPIPLEPLLGAIMASLQEVGAAPASVPHG